MDWRQGKHTFGDIVYVFCRIGISSEGGRYAPPRNDMIDTNKNTLEFLLLESIFITTSFSSSQVPSLPLALTSPQASLPQVLP